MLAQLPYDAHAVKNLREQLWDVFGLGMLDLAARLSEGIQELEVIVRFLMASLDLLFELLEARKIRGACSLEHTNNALELRLLELNVENVKVCGPASPVLDLVKGALGLSAVLRVLI